jgi:hypothetical protein
MSWIKYGEIHTREVVAIGMPNVQKSYGGSKNSLILDSAPHRLLGKICQRLHQNGFSNHVLSFQNIINSIQKRAKYLVFYYFHCLSCKQSWNKISLLARFAKPFCDDAVPNPSPLCSVAARTKETKEKMLTELRCTWQQVIFSAFSGVSISRCGNVLSLTWAGRDRTLWHLGSRRLDEYPNDWHHFDDLLLSFLRIYFFFASFFNT